MGYEPSELIGQHISVLIHPEDYSRANSQDVLKSFRGKITGESHAPKLLDERRKGDRMTSNLQIRLVGKKESATAAPTIYSAMVNAYGEISCSGFFEQDYLNSHEKFEGTVGVIRDISKRVRYERELMDSRLKAEAASRAKSDFIANMSHETRTPLAHILGCVDQILDQEHGLNEKIALDTELNIVEQLKASADQLNSVLEDVLALSELDRGERNINVTPFVCSDLKDSVVQHFESIAFEKGLAFSFDLNAEKH
jgi:signal transduction histidine kinase